MKILDLVEQIFGLLKSSENSVVIKITEFEKELEKYSLSLYDLESGLVLYHVIQRIIIENKEVILDFDKILYIPYAVTSECLERLSYEYGNRLAEHLKVINVPEKDREYIKSCMTCYMITVYNAQYRTNKELVVA